MKSYPMLTLLLALCLPGGPPALAADHSPASSIPGHDIRMLVDVSASMKSNDPTNLRIPALRLIAGLLPSGARAGVWTFGRYVNMLVPHAEVDAPWRDQAMLAATRINSTGLFTDIEAALETATWNWTAPAPGIRRSIILLTDGLVDVSDGADADRQSRARITDHILPRLQGAGATIYSIALSRNSDAALLQQLAAATGGWFERAEDANHLERLFFRMFEKATATDTLPLIDNKVLVDAAINELTLLVFRRENAPPTTVTAPNGASFGKERLPPNARWHHEARYDLVTIEKPMSGTWQVNADTDPDNRVLVVTDLRVVATQLPNQILEGDAHKLIVRFSEKGLAIDNREFLRFLKVTVAQHSADGTKSGWLLLDDGRGGDAAALDGTYSLQLDATLESGRHTITVDVDGTTFRRRLQQEIEVVASPVIADIRADDAGETLFVVPRAGIIDPETLELSATITSADGQIATRSPTRSSPNEWRLPLDGYPPEASHRLTLDIEARRPSGKPLSYRSEPIPFGRAAAADQGAPMPGEPSTSADADTEIPDETADEAMMDDDEEEAARPSLLLVASLVLLINLPLGGGLFLLYLKLFGDRKRPAGGAEPAKDERPPASATNAGQVAAAAARGTAKSASSAVATVSSPAPGVEAVQPDAPAEMSATAQDKSLETTAAQADAGPSARDGSAGQTSVADVFPELVLEDASDQSAAAGSGDPLAGIDIDEIDLGFEEKTRTAG